MNLSKLSRLLRHRARFTAANEAPMLTTITTAINAAIDAKAEWVTLKYGVYPNAVGLQLLDRPAAERMKAAFNSKLNRLANAFRGEPIYPGHPDDASWRKANPGVRTEAVGRLRAVDVGEDGLRLKFAYNDEGQRLVGGEAPAYTSYSPVWGMEETTHQGRRAYRPVEIYSIGLTNTPQIPGTFIGLNEALPPETTTSAPMKEHLIKLLALLGITLSADATDAQATTAINEALPKVQAALGDQGKLTAATNEASTVKAQVATLQSQLTAAQGQVTTATNEAASLRTSLATERSARAEVVLTTAINEGRITAAQKPEWLGKFTATGADFAAIEGELKLKKAINTRSQADVGARRSQPADKKKITAINEAIVSKMKAMGTEDRNTAYLALVREGHELFKNDVAAQ
jgi:hypothetical protein